MSVAQLVTLAETSQIELENTEPVLLEETQSVESIPEVVCNSFLDLEQKLADFFICNHNHIRKLRIIGFFENRIRNDVDLYQSQVMLFQIYHSDTPIACDFRLNPEALERLIENFMDHVWNHNIPYSIQSGLFLSRCELKQHICELTYLIKYGWYED